MSPAEMGDRRHGRSDTKAIQFRFQMDDGRRFENTMIRYLFTNGAVKDVFDFGIRLD